MLPNAGIIQIIFIWGDEMLEVRGLHRLRLMTLACLTTGAMIAFGLFGAGAALAAPTGVTAVIHEGNTETASSTVCTFHIHFQSNKNIAGDWAIRKVASDPTTNVLNGSYDAASGDDREPDSGTFSLPNGHYVLVWDDEPIDRSFDSLAFDVACEAAPPSQSSAPIASASTAPIASSSTAPIASSSTAPISSVLPIASGGQPPNGGVEGVQGTPPRTLPPTDLGTAARSSADPRPTLALLGFITLAALLVTARLGRRKESRRSRPD
jgi:hypothetical protein